MIGRTLDGVGAKTKVSIGRYERGYMLFTFMGLTELRATHSGG